MDTTLIPGVEKICLHIRFGLHRIVHIDVFRMYTRMHSKASRPYVLLFLRGSAAWLNLPLLIGNLDTFLFTYEIAVSGVIAPLGTETIVASILKFGGGLCMVYAMPNFAGHRVVHCGTRDLLLALGRDGSRSIL